TAVGRGRKRLLAQPEVWSIHDPISPLGMARNGPPCSSGSSADEGNLNKSMAERPRMTPGRQGGGLLEQGLGRRCVWPARKGIEELEALGFPARRPCKKHWTTPCR